VRSVVNLSSQQDDAQREEGTARCLSLALSQNQKVSERCVLLTFNRKKPMLLLFA